MLAFPTEFVLNMADIFGPRGFEVGCVFRNPYDYFPRYEPLRSIIRRRVEIFSSELAFPREEIIAWDFACTLMAVGRSVRDHGEIPEEPVEIARILLELS